MKNMLIEIFKPTPIELTLEELEKKLYGRIIAGKTKESILNDLKLLELEGKIFYDARNNTYKTFPSNFFITKITSVKDNEFYFKINSKEYNLPNKNSLKKKDTIILERVHNRFKFIKAIPNIEQEKSNDYDRIVDLFDAYNKSYSLHALAKIIKTDDLTTLQNTLTSLEEQGKVYFNEGGQINTSNNEEKINNPKTGDNIGAVIALFTIATMGLVATIKIRKK